MSSASSPAASVPTAAVLRTWCGGRDGYTVVDRRPPGWSLRALTPWLPAGTTVCTKDEASGQAVAPLVVGHRADADVDTAGPRRQTGPVPRHLVHGVGERIDRHAVRVLSRGGAVARGLARLVGFVAHMLGTATYDHIVGVESDRASYPLRTTPGNRSGNLQVLSYAT